MAFGGSEAAAAQQVSCGDTITTDTTLHHDLVNCPNNGLRIGADDVTLDLNHHTIDGDGKPFAACAEGETCDSGVVAEGPEDITVTNGSVRQFAFTGLNLGPGRHIRVLGVSTARNGVSGILLFRCSRSVVRNSSGIGPTSRVGLWILGGRHVRVLHSSFRQNFENGIEFFGRARFDISWPSHTLIKGNRMSRNGLSGISMGHSNGNRIRRNRIVRGGDGIDAAGSQNVIARNRISHPRLADGIGISLDAGNRNVIAHNSVREPRTTGIGVGFGRAVGNVVLRNHVRGAGKDGFDVDAKAKHTLLKRNHAYGAKDDGLDVNSSSTRLTRNEARRNGDLGIEAVRGVIDGGGNR
jgi:parallel beta-helix repeat protein